jgi:hypothetical protein
VIDANPWAQLEQADGETRHVKATADATAAHAKAPHHTAQMSQGNTHDAQGIASALARRSTVNAAKVVLKQFFIFPEEQLRPMSYQWPASYGQPTSVYPGVLHGVPYESFHFESAPNVKRATVKVVGYDD